MALKEAYDDEVLESWDDESWDDEAEFVSPLIGAAAAPILGRVGSSLGNVLLGRGPNRPALPSVQVSPVRRGVDTASLTTPRGTATIRLPEKVVTEQDFREATQKLQTAINRDTERLNTTQKDIQSLTQRVGVVVADTTNEIAKMRKEQQVALSKLRKEQSSQAMMSMMLGIMTQQQTQRQLEGHTHDATGRAVVTDGDNTALLLLPFMMTGTQEGGTGDNMMMMLMMVIAMRGL